ncbi:MAG: DUF4034 domain-containing protein [Planctomycetota bacterium]
MLGMFVAVGAAGLVRSALDDGPAPAPIPALAALEAAERAGRLPVDTPPAADRFVDRAATIARQHGDGTIARVVTADLTERRRFAAHLAAGEYLEATALVDRHYRARTQTRHGHQLARVMVEAAVDAAVDADSVDAVRAWLAAEPGSWVAHYASACVELSRAWDIRGSGYTHTVDDGDWPAITRHLVGAIAAAKRSLELNPDNGPALTKLIFLATAVDLPLDEVRDIYDRAVAADPADFGPRWAMFNASLPKWGGSVEATCDFVAECLRENPAAPVDLLIVKTHEQFARAMTGPGEFLNIHYWNTARSEGAYAALERLCKKFPQTSDYPRQGLELAARLGHLDVAAEFQLKLFAVSPREAVNTVRFAAHTLDGRAEAVRLLDAVIETGLWPDKESRLAESIRQTVRDAYPYRRGYGGQIANALVDPRILFARHERSFAAGRKVIHGDFDRLADLASHYEGFGRREAAADTLQLVIDASADAEHDIDRWRNVWIDRERGLRRELPPNDKTREELGVVLNRLSTDFGDYYQALGEQLVSEGRDVTEAEAAEVERRKTEIEAARQQWIGSPPDGG